MPETSAHETYLFLGKARADADDVHDIALHDAYIRQMPTAERVEILSLALSLLLLLRKSAAAARLRCKRSKGHPNGFQINRIRTLPY